MAKLLITASAILVATACLLDGAAMASDFPEYTLNKSVAGLNDELDLHLTGTPGATVEVSLFGPLSTDSQGRLRVGDRRFQLGTVQLSTAGTAHLTFKAHEQMGTANDGQPFRLTSGEAYGVSVQMPSGPSTEGKGFRLSSKQPGLASLLTLGVPTAVALTGWATRRPELFVAAPLTLGSGHLYAGDPLRGGYITLGSLGAGLGGALLGAMIYPPLFYRPDPTGMPGVAPNAVGAQYGLAASLLLYSAWASWDAYRTAERHNQNPK